MTTATKHTTADRLTAEERHELPDNKKAALARRILAKAAAYGVNVQSQVIRSWAEE